VVVVTGQVIQLGALQLQILVAAAVHLAIKGLAYFLLVVQVGLA
jgi:hypothetical protein